MSDELRDELEDLKRELRELKEHIKEKPRAEDRRPFMADFGERIGSYVDHVMESVMEGIDAEVDHSVMIGPRGRHIYKRQRRREIEVDPKATADVAGALANENRIEILSQLRRGGKYISELQEKLPDIATSTLSSHLDVLQEAGLVAQERTRGRYLVTLPGRVALKMMKQITRILQESEEESEYGD